MLQDFSAWLGRWFAPDRSQPGYLGARWLFLRALGAIFFSAFYSFYFQVRGLIGPYGLLPAADYLRQVAHALGGWRFWYTPSIFWWSASDRALILACVIGMIASAALCLNAAPRIALAVSLILFLSLIAVAQDFASYQSDGMLLEAGFISLFFVPGGWRPGFGRSDPPSRASRFLLLWLMFRIYFESGIAKILGHDVEWRNFTAMDHYYENGPLPTWIAWYAQHLPHGFHAFTAMLTLALELVLIFAMFLPRRFRLALFCVITPWQVGIILTSNYAFLNYLVLVLGFLLLDDRFLARVWPQARVPSQLAPEPTPSTSSTQAWLGRARVWVQATCLSWIFYATTALLISMVWPIGLPAFPIRVLEPFRFANDFGLFAVMTRERYDIEFQGSSDGQNWSPYTFRNKPQAVNQPPRIYAPYQPRFDWNLWFASLGQWRQYPFVIQVERRLLANQPQVIALFASNPFPDHPPLQVRAVLWRYWFSDPQEKRTRGLWWDRELVGLYAPTLEREPDGKTAVTEWPDSSESFSKP
jgi:hypothetical protein